MPWEPTTDFEEEVVNLQPHHDFIYGTLSEPVFSYPRPKAHTEYAANKKEQNKECQAGSKINEQLRVIQQVQFMAGTKPIGEQACIEDWENNENIERETIGMMRFCGMAASVEQPLDEKVTIATYPVNKTIKVVKNGRRKVALFFDDDVFKFQEKISDTSEHIEICKINKNDSLSSELDGNISFNTSSSPSLNSFSTVGEFSDSFSSATPCKNTPLIYTREQRLQQYKKLNEATALLSLDSSSIGSYNSTTSRKQNSDSFKTAQETSCWKPISFEDYDDDVFSKKEEQWPSLSKDLNVSESKATVNKSQDDNSSNEISSEATSSCNNGSKRKSFLDRFVKSEETDDLNTTANSTATTSSQEASTSSYADITKKSMIDQESSSKPKELKDSSSDWMGNFPRFYTTRRMYALKRSGK